MDVLVAGGHGKVARHLLPILVGRGHRVRATTRDPRQVADLEQLGAIPVLCDLEHDDVRPHVGAAEAIVFAAGAGPGSGQERKRTLDYGAAVDLVEAARELGVRRYLMVSSMGADDPAAAPEKMRPYQQAKHDADEALMASGLDWTVVRPGGLTDGPAAGLVDIALRLGRSGQVTRADVALVLADCLEEEGTIGKHFELLEGATPVREALRAL